MIDDNKLIKERGKTMQRFYEDGNTNKWEMEAKRTQDRRLLMNGQKREKKKVRRGKIEETRSARDYRNGMVEEKLKYLIQKGKEKKLKMLARFRCCNKWKVNIGKKKKICRLCKTDQEILQHMRELQYICEKTKEIGKTKTELMNERGEDLNWMQWVIRIRERKETRAKEEVNATKEDL